MIRLAECSSCVHSCRELEKEAPTVRGMHTGLNSVSTWAGSERIGPVHPPTQGKPCSRTVGSKIKMSFWRGAANGTGSLLRRQILLTRKNIHDYYKVQKSWPQAHRELMELPWEKSMCAHGCECEYVPMHVCVSVHVCASMHI